MQENKKIENRSDIKNFISILYNDITKKRKAIRELEEADMLLSDNEQWYTEEIEKITISLRPKIIKESLVGKINWVEGFIDEDTNTEVKIERSEVVKVDGKWVK